jgi:hypothetical protein
VRSCLRPLRGLDLASPAALGPPKVRQVASWMLRHPDNRSPQEQVRLKQVLGSCSHLAATAEHVTGFAEIITRRQGKQLDRWIEQVESDDLPHLHSFAAGLKRGYSAVINGLTLPHSSGAVEGNVNFKDDQTPDVWTSEVRPALKADPAPNLKTTYAGNHGD